MGSVARCCRLLYVEDHQDTLDVTCKLLRAAGHTVVGVNCCAAARKAADDGERFDLLIADLALPDGDGLELLADMRRHYAIDGIVLSGHGLDADLIHSRAAGFAVHLLKPIDFQSLAKAIDNVMARRKERRDSAGMREGAA
jgi:DNA-binding response OmpR family regulator